MDAAIEEDDEPNNGDEEDDDDADDFSPPPLLTLVLSEDSWYFFSGLSLANRDDFFLGMPNNLSNKLLPAATADEMVGTTDQNPCPSEKDCRREMQRKEVREPSPK